MTTTTTRVQRINLDLGAKLGAGAQGSLYVVRNAGTLPGPPFPFPVIYKEFHPKTQVSGPALDVLARFRSDLDDHDRQVIDAMTVWPCVVVDDGTGRSCGYLMQRIPDRFLQHIETTSGKEQIAREIQQLFVPDAIARKNLGETANRVERMAIVRDLAFALGFLHKRDFVYGDVSYKNAVFCLRPHPGVMLLDCDAVRKIGQSAAVAQLHSPGWKPPEGGPQTKATDRYKLGLAVLRCLTPGVNAQNRDPAKAAGHLDSEGMSLLRRALGDDPEKRTTGREWVQYFNQAIERAGGVRQRPGTAPAPKPNPVRRAPPRTPTPLTGAGTRALRASVFGASAPTFTRTRSGALQPARRGTAAQSGWTTGAPGQRNAFGSPLASPFGLAKHASTSASPQVADGFQAAVIVIFVLAAIIIVGVIAASSGTKSSSKFSIPTTSTSRRTSSSSGAGGSGTSTTAAPRPTNTTVLNSSSVISPEARQSGADWASAAVRATKDVQAELDDPKWALAGVSTERSLIGLTISEGVKTTLTSPPTYLTLDYVDTTSGPAFGQRVAYRTFIVNGGKIRERPGTTFVSGPAAARPIVSSWAFTLAAAVAAAQSQNSTDPVKVAYQCDEASQDQICGWGVHFVGPKPSYMFFDANDGTSITRPDWFGGDF